MRKNCETCKHDDRLRKLICDECYNTSDAPTKWEPAAHYKPDTNADRIRAMTDEELAKHFSGLICTINEGVEYYEAPSLWLEWLKQPAEEGAAMEGKVPR